MKNKKQIRQQQRAMRKRQISVARPGRPRKLVDLVRAMSLERSGHSSAATAARLGCSEKTLERRMRELMADPHHLRIIVCQAEMYLAMQGHWPTLRRLYRKVIGQDIYDEG